MHIWDYTIYFAAAFTSDMRSTFSKLNETVCITVTYCYNYFITCTVGLHYNNK